MTEKLYYVDNSVNRFEARIIESLRESKSWKVVLDRTYFYPAGGGQPADKGWINGIPITHVQMEGDAPHPTIYHYLPQNPGSGTAECELDSEWRWDFMQQHTGQHIISGAIWKVAKFRTISVHMGTDYTAIEFETPGISDEALLEAERLANRVIRDDLPVNAIHTVHSDLDKFPLRKSTHRTGDIRLIQIGDFDCVACGGVHCSSTRMVQMVKAVSVEKIRGNTRIAFKIGERALEDYNQKHRIISRLKPFLATNEDNYPDKAKQLNRELEDYRKKCGKLEHQLAEVTAQILYRDRQTPQNSPYGIIIHAWNDEDDQFIKRVARNLLKEKNLVLCLVNRMPGKLQWSIGCSQDCVFPFDELKGNLLAPIDGKGGGRHPLWQGSGTKPEAVESFFSMLKKSVANI